MCLPLTTLPHHLLAVVVNFVLVAVAIETHPPPIFFLTAFVTTSTDGIVRNFLPIYPPHRPMASRRTLHQECGIRWSSAYSAFAFVATRAMSRRSQRCP
ncbi:hypothetical protein DENSPDRAFT_616335 [Dentipellis sp. KUC8613]|nr:hypothetical protein DENSPDRAFT_616335 [Dentipellis sp. KUC8613]